MENLRLFLIIVVLCAVFGNALSQNRGSVRYGAPAAEDYDGESTRTQRPPPTRTTSVRRRRPVSAPEPPVVENDQSFQSHQLSNQEGTTGRRVPSRVNTQRYAPQISSVPVPIEESAPLSPAVADELPHIPVAEPEEKPKVRRRRPKKRRKPQGVSENVPTDEEKQTSDIPDKNKVSIELTDKDQKRPQSFRSDSESRNNPNAYDSSGLADKAVWSNGKFEDNGEDSGRRNAGASQYFPPQAGTNRLPLESPEEIESSRRYPEASPPVSSQDVPNRRYIPEPAVELPNRGSYVPVLSPVRVPTEDVSRLQYEAYPENRNEERTRSSIPSDYRNQHRTSTNRSPSLPTPNQRETTSSDTKPHQKAVLRNNQPSIPDRSHSEVRLPQPEQPLISSDYGRNFNAGPEYGTSEEINSGLRDDTRAPEPHNEDGVPKPTNRLPNPSEVHYESVYPSYLDENVNTEQISRSSVPHRRQETEPHTSGDTVIPYSNVIRKDSSEPSQNNNNVDTGRPAISRYEPPLQRAGSRYNSEGSGASTRSRAPSEDPPVEVPTRSREPTRSRSESSSETFTRTRDPSSNKPSSSVETPTRTRSANRYQPDSSIETPTRTRGLSRHEPESSSDTSTRTRGSSRYQPDSSIATPTRTRNSQAQVPDQQLPRSRNTQRYQSDSESDSRLSSRRQQVNPEINISDERQPADQSYRQRVSSSPNEESPQPNISYDDPISSPEDGQPDDTFPVRNTLRSRPQYEVRDTEQPYSYEEPSSGQDPNAYVPEYQQAPRQQDRREQVNQRNPPPREQPAPRPTSRRENLDQRAAPRQQQPDYRAPQPPARQQTQYQAPENERNQARQPPPRQQTRPRQEPAAAQNQGRTSSSSKFVCPEPYGFFGDRVQCDRYYECRNGTAVDSLCEDGLAFNELNAPKYLRCDSIRDVDCSSRPELQEARPTKNCPRRYGLFPHEGDCTKFFNCVDGTATEVQCPPGLTFNDDRATCDWADLVKSSCTTEDLLGFTCPDPSAYDLQDGVYTSYPHPDNCQLHFVCIKGEDGERRPRMLACNEGLVYNPSSSSCSRPDDVPGCEDFYGSRSPTPKRKPARDPLPEEPEEEPTPKPRRRTQNRRTRT